MSIFNAQDEAKVLMNHMSFLTSNMFYITGKQKVYYCDNVQTIYALYTYKQFMHCIICTNNLCTV